MDSFVTLADDSHRVHAAEGRHRGVRKKFHRDTRLACTSLIDHRPPSFPRLFIPSHFSAICPHDCCIPRLTTGLPQIPYLKIPWIFPHLQKNFMIFFTFNNISKFFCIFVLIWKLLNILLTEQFNIAIIIINVALLLIVTLKKVILQL